MSLSAVRTDEHDLYLDWLRGLAALAVFLGHVRGGFFVKWSDLDPASQSAINYILFFLTRLGREAVVIFFVLSGYLVGGQALIASRARKYSFGSYLVARISRLYTVLIPGLLLTAVLDCIRLACHSESSGLRAYVVNLLFLQGIAGPVYGSNAPLWSLSYEWWYYVLFGIAASVLAFDSLVKRSLLALLIGALITWLFGACPELIFMFPLWLLGAGVRVLPVRQLSSALVVGVVAMFLGALVVSNLRGDLWGNYVIGLSTSALIYTVRVLPPIRQSWFHFGNPLAAFSFSLYALHYPLNALIENQFVPYRLSHAGTADWALMVGLAVMAAAPCFAAYWMFERNTSMVRRWLQGKLSIVPPGAASTVL